jgi:hypothetical protein
VRLGGGNSGASPNIFLLIFFSTAP